uniref:Putative chitinase 3 n=1 Tax=Schizaphis graminum TaxID=13262 RepID=A0A2S2PIB7_SCHGA
MTASHKTAATVVVLLLACVLSGLCQEQKNGEEFKCPEEFGYYPHPNDCSQYYVCVFGGALLESCTGGLMYSHELQTCDWPRNVGCGAETSATQPDNQENALALARSSDRQRHPSAQPQRATPSIFNQHHQVQDQQVNEQLVKQQQLYEEEDFRAIEDDSDRQQRVYRGQPSTLGQVARDRDGISKHRNIIPVTN